MEGTAFAVTVAEASTISVALDRSAVPRLTGLGPLVHADAPRATRATTAVNAARGARRTRPSWHVPPNRRRPARCEQGHRSTAPDGSASAGGGTAIYDTLVLAYKLIGDRAATDPDRITTIVLLTDGENTTG